MRAVRKATFYTLGYQGHPLEAILATLSEAGVDRVADVRAVAESTAEGFSRDELGAAFDAAGLEYVHFGELGDFQPDPYPVYMRSPEWGRAFEKLRACASVGTTCLLCACRDVSACHRRFLGARLRQEGFSVLHLTPDGASDVAWAE